MTSFRGVRRVELLVDLLNVFNDNAEEGLATDNLFSPNFGQGVAFVDPRHAMVSARVNLGPVKRAAFISADRSGRCPSSPASGRTRCASRPV